MAAGDVTYGTRSALANVSRMQGVADSNAYAFGQIVNDTSNAALDFDIRIKAPLSSGATGGNYSLYLVESQDGLEWTDDINPFTTINTWNASARLSDAELIKVSDTTYNAADRSNVEFHFKLSDITAFPSKYTAFVLQNNSDTTTPGGNADGDYMTIKIATS